MDEKGALGEPRRWGDGTGGAMLGRTLITHEVPEHRTSSLGSLISRPLEVICGSSGKARKNLFYMEQ